MSTDGGPADGINGSDGSDGGAGTELSFIVRIDLRVINPDAVIHRARQAVLDLEPAITEDELDEEVGEGIDGALFAIANAAGVDALIEDVDGLEVKAVVSEIAYDLDEISFEELTDTDDDGSGDPGDADDLVDGTDLDGEDLR